MVLHLTKELDYAECANIYIFAYAAASRGIAPKYGLFSIINTFIFYLNTFNSLVGVVRGLERVIEKRGLERRGLEGTNTGTP